MVSVWFKEEDERSCREDASSGNLPQDLSIRLTSSMPRHRVPMKLPLVARAWAGRAREEAEPPEEETTDERTSCPEAEPAAAPVACPSAKFWQHHTQTPKGATEPGEREWLEDNLGRLAVLPSVWPASALTASAGALPSARTLEPSSERGEESESDEEGPLTCFGAGRMREMRENV